jgi:orotidine-5'-phosphate decarboxylase
MRGNLQQASHRRVRKLAKIASDCRAHGFVCSPKKRESLKNPIRQLIVTPAFVRPEWLINDSNRASQRRAGQGITEPTSLLWAGQILEAADPVAEMGGITRGTRIV